MSAQGHLLFIVACLAIVGSVCVAGMKFFADSRQARRKDGKEDTYRELTEKYAASQAASSAALAALQADFADMKGRLAAIEKVLRDVG
ncbi:MAG: hypothetical protein ABSD74_16740 [Rhizomicrobium sp.]|jgi:Tfp pilus assembly protein PilO